MKREDDGFIEINFTNSEIDIVFVSNDSQIGERCDQQLIEKVKENMKKEEEMLKWKDYFVLNDFNKSVEMKMNSFKKIRFKQRRLKLI